MRGVKHDMGKRQWSLLPWRSLNAVLDVLAFGARKYAPDNWQHVEDARRRYFDATMRHLVAHAAGERLDPESGQLHLAHAGASLLFLLWFEVGDAPTENAGLQRRSLPQSATVADCDRGGAPRREDS